MIFSDGMVQQGRTPIAASAPGSGLCRTVLAFFLSLLIVTFVLLAATCVCPLTPRMLPRQSSRRVAGLSPSWPSNAFGNISNAAWIWPDATRFTRRNGNLRLRCDWWHANWTWPPAHANTKRAVKAGLRTLDSVDSVKRQRVVARRIDGNRSKRHAANDRRGIGCLGNTTAIDRAQERLAFGVGHEPTASMALYLLGRSQIAIMGETAEERALAGPKAIAMYQTALAVDPADYLAANELGVTLARYGQLDEAYRVLGTARGCAAARNAAQPGDRLRANGEHRRSPAGSGTIQRTHRGSAGAGQNGESAKLVRSRQACDGSIRRSLFNVPGPPTSTTRP